jgi:ribosomal protein S18 acetylase RimI-like enzyme
LMGEVERLARETGRTAIELETRVELTENHRTFESLGFEKVSEHAHEGYDRPTYIRMRRFLRAGA